MTATATALSRERIALADGEIAVLRFGEEGRPLLLFAHANGFCASAYRRMLTAVADRFDVYAVDLRGHGATTLSADPRRYRDMGVFGRDIGAFLDLLRTRCDGRKWTLAGHSLGAVAATLAAAGRSDIAALRLIEPVATPPYWRYLAMSPLWGRLAAKIPLVRSARGRRAQWPDRGAVRRSYSQKPLFSSWADGVLDDYLEDGLREADDGVALACAPAWEAAIFSGHAHDFWGALRKARAPVAVLAASDASSTVSSRAENRFRSYGAKVERIGGRTHLLPLENPAAAGRFIAADQVLGGSGSFC